MSKTAFGLYLTAFVLIFSHLCTMAQTDGTSKIDTLDLRRHLEFFASDELSGRWVDTPDCGICKAAEYLKSNVAQMGLKEGFQGFRQPVKLISAANDTLNSYLGIFDNKRKIAGKTNDFVGVISENELLISRAPLVFAGFGWSDEKSGYNDFSGVNVKGKLVFFSTGTPETFGLKEQRWNNRLETDKIKKAFEAGAAGVILVMNPADSLNINYNRLKDYLNRETWKLKTSEQTQENPFVLTNAGWADKISGGKGSFRNLLKQIAGTKKPNSFTVKEFSATVEIKRKITEIESANIVAVVEGSDPVLKNECVVFMAHYDHLGIDKTGDIFNGADDNGSGTVALLELAEAFKNADVKPKRSIVFLWVTAEEVGLLGSKFYTENPLFPMGKTVACINLDMVGRVLEPRDSVWNRSPKKVKNFDGIFAVTNNVWPQLKELTTAACTKTGLIPDFSLPSYFLGSSDHASFNRKGVAVLNLSTGYHADYHKPTDEIKKINFEKMKRVADLCFWLGLDIANAEIIPIQNNTN